MGPILSQIRSKVQVCPVVEGVVVDMPEHHRDEVCTVLADDDTQDEEESSSSRRKKRRKKRRSSSISLSYSTEDCGGSPDFAVDQSNFGVDPTFEPSATLYRATNEGIKSKLYPEKDLDFSGLPFGFLRIN